MIILQGVYGEKKLTLLYTAGVSVFILTTFLEIYQHELKKSIYSVIKNAILKLLTKMYTKNVRKKIGKAFIYSLNEHLLSVMCQVLIYM